MATTTPKDTRASGVFSTRTRVDGPIACDRCRFDVRPDDVQYRARPLAADYLPGGILAGQGERLGVIVLHETCARDHLTTQASTATLNQEEGE